MIEIRDLYKVFGGAGKTVLAAVRDGMERQELLDRHGSVLGLRDINMAVPRHCIQVVMGLSGSGKSTLLRHINRLIEPTAGCVVVGGSDLADMGTTALREFRRRKTSMVFQRFALMPHRTVRANVGYGLEIQGRPVAEIRKRTSHWLERVGLEGFADRHPRELSGGMQQRVGLARALATDPEILLMDEAFSALDPLIRFDMQGMLLDLQKELQKTVVFITHDLDEAVRIGDQVAILRDGGIVQQGKPEEIVLSPADDYVAEFVKGLNRGQVLRVESVMDPLPRETTGLTIPIGTPLERALLTLSQNRSDRGIVTDGKGVPVGQVSRSGLLEAMLRRAKPAS